jgi:alkylation response protein AidB-like acyl-CoA dehydrogenase
MYTLGHERGTAALPRQVKLRTWLDQLVAEAAERQIDGASLLGDATNQVELARAMISIEVLRHHAYRTVGEFLKGGAVGEESSTVKLLSAEAEQVLTNTALDVLGPTLYDGDPERRAANELWYETYLYSRAASVYGGSRQIQRGIIADRILKLPVS